MGFGGIHSVDQWAWSPGKGQELELEIWDSLVIRGSESCGSGNNFPVGVQSERRT